MKEYISPEQTQCCHACKGTGIERIVSNTKHVTKDTMKTCNECTTSGVAHSDPVKTSCIVDMENHPLVRGLGGMASLRNQCSSNNVYPMKRGEYSNAIISDRYDFLPENLYQQESKHHHHHRVRSPRVQNFHEQQADECSHSNIQLHSNKRRNITGHHHHTDGHSNVMTNSSRMLLKAHEGMDHRFTTTKTTRLEHDCCSHHTCGNLAAGFAKLAAPYQEEEAEMEHVFEPVFTSYNCDDCGIDHMDEEDMCDISDTNFDFRTLSGFTIEEDFIDPASISIIDMICGTFDLVDDETAEQTFDLGSTTCIEIAPSHFDTSLYTHVHTAPSKRSRATKKGKGSRAHRGDHTSHIPPTTATSPVDDTLVSITYGNNEDQMITDENVEWYPGFSRQLGAKGRSAILDLVRRVYRQDPNHYKAILQARSPPSSISNLPFFNIPMLWELTHQFGVFKQAILVHKNQQTVSLKSERSRSKSKAERHTVVQPTATEAPVVVPQQVESMTHNTTSQIEPIATVPLEYVPSPKRSNVATHEADVTRVKKHQKVKNESPATVVVDNTRHGITSFSGRSIKPCKRYVDYQEDSRKPIRELSTKSSYSDGSQSLDLTQIEAPSPSLSHSSITDMSKTTEGSLEVMMSSAQVPPLSLFWRVTQELAKKDRNADTHVERITPVSSARSTPTRCISV